MLHFLKSEKRINENSSLTWPTGKFEKEKKTAPFNIHPV